MFSNLLKNSGFIFLVFVTLFACKRDEVKEEFVAKVNNEFLTKEILNDYLNSKKYESKHRQELIMDWVKNQVLYLEAKRNGILEEKEFQKLTSGLEKQLAASLLLEKISDNMEIDFDERDLEYYYQHNKDEFSLPSDAVVFNRIVFNNREKAIQFRSVLLDTDWQKSLNVFIGDESINNYDTEKLFYLHEIYPQTLLRYLINLRPSETSIVFETEPKQFTIVQVKSKFKKNELPNFVQIRDLVYERYLLHQRKNYLTKYIDELIPQYNVEIKRLTDE